MTEKETHTHSDPDLCTDLILPGNPDIATLYLEPEFWLQEIADLGLWWKKHAIDPKVPGYFTNLDRKGNIWSDSDGADKWGYVVSRTLYTFTTAFSLTGQRKFLEAAKSGVAFLSKAATFRCSGYTFFHARMNRNGDNYPNDPDVINIFTQIYALTGLIAYFGVTHDPSVSNLIDSCLRGLTDLYHDNEHGGYYDAISRANLEPIPGITDGKSFNSIVDPLSATLYFMDNARITSKHLPIQNAIRELCQLILQHFVDPHYAFIRETFHRTWVHQAPAWNNPYNTPFSGSDVGANMKTIWVLLRGLDDLDPMYQQEALNAVDRIHKHIVDSGTWDAVHGGWFAVMNRDCVAGTLAHKMGHTNKIWWQQEEGILACFLSYLVLRRDRDLAMTREGLRFWLTYFRDHTNGGVFDTVSVDGEPIEDRKGYWLKWGYHEIELARYMYIYSSVLNNREVTLFSDYDASRSFAEYRCCPARIPGLIWDVIDEELVENTVLMTRYRHRWVSVRQSKVQP